MTWWQALFEVVFQYLVLFLFLSPIIAVIVYKRVKYKKSSYYTITKNTRKEVLRNTGLRGEYQIYQQLAEYEKSGGKFLFNVYVPKEDGSTSEIDIILICHSGIFVIESKNYSGWIFGNDSDSMWTQSLPQGRESKKEHFFNPIKQNESHILYLTNYLKRDYTCFSIVVFSNSCQFVDLKVSRNDVAVIHRDSVYNVISSLCTEERISDEEIKNIYDLLYPLTQKTEAEKQQHVEMIKAALEEKCPRCGGKLILRTAKRGDSAGNKFYGCSNYPNCRYTRNVQDSERTTNDQK